MDATGNPAAEDESVSFWTHGDLGDLSAFGEDTAGSEWSTASMSSWSDSESSSSGDCSWLDMDFPDAEELSGDGGLSADELSGAQATASSYTVASNGLTPARDARAQQSVQLSPSHPFDPQLKPLRMTVQPGQQTGDVCHARVPSTGQRVAGHVPAGLIPGDKFLIMYRPETPSYVGASPRLHAHTVEAAMENARVPQRKLAVVELVALMHASTWAGSKPPMRPLRMQTPAASVLYREPRKHKRRQKRSLGAIDRWKNTGGKHAAVKLDIPTVLRRDQSNALVARHGKVLRPDGTQVKYQQWSFATVLPNGDWKEHRGLDDLVLYRVFHEPADQVRLGTPPPLDESLAAPLDEPLAAPLPEPLAAPLPEPLAAPLPEPLAEPWPVSRPPSAASESWPARTATELDFSLLGRSVAKRTFEESLVGGGLDKKKRVSSALYAGVAALAILGVVAYHVHTKPETTGSADDMQTHVTCSGTPENLLHALKSSVHNCTQRVGQECQLLCEPGYEPSGTLRCGQGTTVLDGNAACKICKDNTFSADGGECKACEQCDLDLGEVPVTACTPTTDIRCAQWTGHSFAANQTQPLHLPQFPAVWGTSSTTFVFGGKGSASTPSPQTSADSGACAVSSEPLSSELWERDSSQRWRLLGGSVARSVDTPVGENGSAWPAPRSSAASWAIPSDISARNILGPAAVVFSGSYLAPCAEHSTAIGVRQLLNPSDMWVYGQQKTKPSWTLIGGEPSWAEPPRGLMQTLQQGYLTLPTIGSDLTQSTAAALPGRWPLGRHDAHTWVLGGVLLMFSGAMDLYLRDAGLAQMSKRAYLLNDYWLMHIEEDSIAWETGGGLDQVAHTSPRHAQPGPRLFGATWTSMNRTSGAEMAWLFGGVGSTYSTGGAYFGSAVAASTDDLRSLCDLWVYRARPSSVQRTADAKESPWQLVGACALDMPQLAEHADSLGVPLGLPPQSPLRAAASNMMLTEAVLAATWVDSNQNLWLFGGARCRQNSCASVVHDILNPRRGRRQLQDMYRPPSMPPAARGAFISDGVTVPGEEPYPGETRNPEGVTVPGEEPFPGETRNPDGPGIQQPLYPSYPFPSPATSGSGQPRTYPVPSAGQQSSGTASGAVIPCVDELWKFDTVSMEWSAFSKRANPTATAHIAIWPMGECGASSIPGETVGAESSATELIGGWDVRPFGSCGSDMSDGAYCSRTSWSLGPL